jgi:hypothetical protein
MSTRQKPLPESCVYFDRQRCWLGLPRIAQGLEAALAAWEIQTHRSLANQPDPADLVRVARLQALIATTTLVVSEAAARRGEIDAGVIDRLTPALENAQLAWSRSARRWAQLTTPASRTDPALTEAASQLRAAIRAAVANQTSWATSTRTSIGYVFAGNPDAKPKTSLRCSANAAKCCGF